MNQHLYGNSAIKHGLKWHPGHGCGTLPDHGRCGRGKRESGQRKILVARLHFLRLKESIHQAWQHLARSMASLLVTLNSLIFDMRKWGSIKEGVRGEQPVKVSARYVGERVGRGGTVVTTAS